MCRRGPLQRGVLGSGGRERWRAPPRKGPAPAKCATVLETAWGAGGVLEAVAPRGVVRALVGVLERDVTPIRRLGSSSFYAAYRRHLGAVPMLPPGWFGDPVSCLGFSRRAWGCRGSSLGLPYACGFPEFIPAVALGEHCGRGPGELVFGLFFPSLCQQLFQFSAALCVRDPVGPVGKACPPLPPGGDAQPPAGHALATSRSPRCPGNLYFHPPPPVLGPSPSLALPSTTTIWGARGWESQAKQTLTRGPSSKRGTSWTTENRGCPRGSYDNNVHISLFRSQRVWGGHRGWDLGRRK